jgi:probable DNA repair protein
MGPSSPEEIDAWLRQGGIVVTASERAARAVTTAFHRARQAEGHKAWPAPSILDWKTFVRQAWSARTVDGRLLLNPTQEQSIWAALAAADGRFATVLEGPRYRFADLAMQAHDLLCSHAPAYLHTAARAEWPNDAGAFSRWLTSFDDTCRTQSLLSPARLPLELISLLQSPSPKEDRPPLLLAGFDRILPVQRDVFNAWGAWQRTATAAPPAHISFHEAADDQAELTACALWAENLLANNPHARILVITQDAIQRRGQIERAFLRLENSSATSLFEFSLGIPLSQVALPRAALMLLRWLRGSLAEHELDWLFSTGYAAANPEETSALQSRMRALRRDSLAQPFWSLDAFLAPVAGRARHTPAPPSWVERITQARQRLNEAARKPQSPLDWSELIPQLLQQAAWPGDHPLSSAEFQAATRWQQAVETAGSIGFDGRRVDAKEFHSALARTLEETLFAPQSSDAPIQIAGPAESAGLTADAIWFLGVSESAWPATASMHPLIPREIQRDTHMPHATPLLDWDLAQSITTRLIASAPEIHFSYAKQVEGTEARPSRLIAQLTGAPQSLPSELIAPAPASPLAAPSEDTNLIPYPLAEVHGGAAVMTWQSQCPFKAFATARLDANTWQPAEAGLDPRQRGQLLHDVLHAIWAGPPRGIRTHAELIQLTDRKPWVAMHVARVFDESLNHSLRARMPARYLELEQQRLTRLINEWLDYESTRIPFEVLETELSRTVPIEGLAFNLRLDRLDRLNDGTVLVIDYKTGDVSPKLWDLPRPDDVQLPLYARFALDGEQTLGGLAFAKIRPDERAFVGCIGDPAATLLPNLKSNTTLMKHKMELDQLEDWEKYIKHLANDFLAGHAAVDPREAPKTCERCGLQTLCRIQERQLVLSDDDEVNNAEASDD